jgi:hypothetical protein
MIRLDKSRLVYLRGEGAAILARWPLDILDRDKTAFFCSSQCPD